MKLEYQQCLALETMRIEVETKSWVENMGKFCVEKFVDRGLVLEYNLVITDYSLKVRG